MNKLVKLLFIHALLISSFSCKKFLDEKPEKSLIIPGKLADLQALLDNYRTLNQQYPQLLEIVADDYYVKSEDYSASPLAERQNYVWDADASYLSMWYVCYRKVYPANIVLDELSKKDLSKSDEKDIADVKGQALFFRSFAFYHAAQLYCKPYSSTADTDPGIPLKLTPDAEDKSFRSTIQQTYDRIIDDLKQAAELLPESVIAFSRPNKAAAYGALARTYLTMRDYPNAGRYADSALKRNNALMDYNNLDTAASTPIMRNSNQEIIFYSIMDYAALLFPPTAKVDTVLYNSYDNNDLRKKIFYFLNNDGTYSYKGSYDGTSYFSTLFNGIAVDEMYLIRAETHARAGNKTEAVKDLNTLLEKRWASASWVPYNANSANEALQKIIQERRKELVYRGLRWPDLRRYNIEGANISIKRQINGQSLVVLSPNDPKWVLLIPKEVISLTGMPQNDR